MIGGIVDAKYRLLRLLGQGGMGSVYEAERVGGSSEAAYGGETSEPLVALKLIVPEMLDHRDAAALARFRREAKAASAAHTEHIVRVLDFGTDPATEAPYMAMELLEGVDLEQVLSAAGALPPDAVLRIAAQVCLGLEKAHEARVIHRDIKPANIFLARGKGGRLTAKILDFGVAKIKPSPGDDSSVLTKSGSILGSPRYMSPEQAKGSKRIDFRTDLWSLGFVLYRALTGKLPHHESRSLSELILDICMTPPQSVQELAPWVPAEVAAVVHGALHLEPDERFPSAAAMLDALRPLLPSGWDLDEGSLEDLDRKASTRTALRSLLTPEQLACAGKTTAHIQREATTLDPAASSTVDLLVARK